MATGKHLVWMAGLWAIALLAVCVSLASAQDGAAAPQAQPAHQGATLESLLKAAGLQYYKLTGPAEGNYKVMVSLGTGNQANEVVPVIVREATIGGQSGPKMVVLWSQVLAVPEGFQHPPAMLKKIALLNDNMPVGKISINDKNGCVFYASAFYLQTADEKTMQFELSLAFWISVEFAKELRPFVKES
jgi:hypothetical protein